MEDNTTLPAGAAWLERHWPLLSIERNLATMVVVICLMVAGVAEIFYIYNSLECRVLREALETGLTVKELKFEEIDRMVDERKKSKSRNRKTLILILSLFAMNVVIALWRFILNWLDILQDPEDKPPNDPLDLWNLAAMSLSIMLWPPLLLIFATFYMRLAKYASHTYTKQWISPFSQARGQTTMLALSVNAFTFFMLVIGPFVQTWEAGLRSSCAFASCIGPTIAFTRAAYDANSLDFPGFSYASDQTDLGGYLQVLQDMQREEEVRVQKLRKCLDRDP